MKFDNSYTVAVKRSHITRTDNVVIGRHSVRIT